ncbi:hypothetical protein [Galbitalea soli]|uniref:DUF4142 domain-containing protein n=1 Tax=Galbitalea soli TaxID=1268042 RepID=A0A7C9TPQ1_9MICO|nr:hypothetical protein [Galbitalea soli]NEM89763.1 hypothetical protein [Galbitalea soli]NYJ30465.1 hypothetical protein [Galbitalea soli]
MKRSIRTGLVGAALAATTTATLVLAGGAPAFAAAAGDAPTGSPTTLAAIQRSATLKTDQRITSLTTAVARITALHDVTDSDRAQILATLNADIAGMKTVEATIQADTTVAQAKADYRTIFTGYRVYAVALPQAHFAAAADRLTATSIPRLTSAHDRLAAALAGPKASKSTPALQADLADMAAKTSAASALLNGLAAKALAVTPSAFNADHTVMQPIRSDLRTAIAHLKQARADGELVLAAIR